ncbi:hypothetical protein LTR28_004226, partial [Elasticomyces elasticus]
MARTAAPAMPPAMAEVKQHTADEVLAMMNRMPLFMTSLDESDGADGSNAELDAIRALVYEGTRAEVAENFRQQGNEMARVRRWGDAREYYTKALAAVRGEGEVQRQREGKGEEEWLEKAGLVQELGEDGEPDLKVVQVDEEAERKKEKEIEE